MKYVPLKTVPVGPPNPFGFVTVTTSAPWVPLPVCKVATPAP